MISTALSLLDGASVELPEVETKRNRVDLGAVGVTIAISLIVPQFSAIACSRQLITRDRLKDCKFLVAQAFLEREAKEDSCMLKKTALACEIALISSTKTHT